MSNPDYPIDIYPGDTSTTAVLNPYDPDGGLDGYIPLSYGAQDHDWFKVTLAAGRTYNFRVYGISDQQYSMLYYPSLTLRDANGAQIAFDDNPSSLEPDPWIMYTPTASGTYYLDVTADIERGITGGGYYVSALADDNPWNIFDLTDMPSVNVGGSSNGFIDYQGDTDYFQTNLVAHRHYVFQEVGSGSSQLSQSALVLHDASGNVQAQENYRTGSGFWSDILYTPAVTGVYILEAGAKNANLGTYTVTVHYVTVQSDFGDDSISDIGLQNTNGSVAVWDMNGPAIQANGAAMLANPGTAWKLIGSGDFYGEGAADLLLQNTQNGALAYWGVVQGASGPTLNMSETLQLPANLNPGPTWHAIATGDFNGDGYADIAFQNDDSSVAVWDMNGSSLISNGSAALAKPGSAWHLRATGDFYYDGASDLLLQNNDGSLAIWDVTQTIVGPALNLAKTTALPANLDPGPNWVVKGTGDFNIDGHGDFVLQNTQTGDVAIWEMNGASLLSAAVVASPGTAWSVKSVGDYNGDGVSDILLQNSQSGALAMWFMSGLSLLPSSTQLAANPGTSWSPVN